MQLVRCSAQSYQTLDEFYSDIAANEPPHYGRTGPAMLSLIKRLRELPDDRKVWGLTSLSRLCLLAQDAIFENDVFMPWFVVVAGGTNEYYVEYRMPETIAPWPNAYVRGEARSEDEAVEMILTAMERSGGWAKSA